MDIIEVHRRADALGLTGLDGMSKGDIIRAIQIAEGSRDCYGKILRHDYPEYNCCWRDDCLTPKPE